MMVFGAVGGSNNPCHFTGRFHRRFPLQFFPRASEYGTRSTSLVYGSDAHAQWVGPWEVQLAAKNGKVVGSLYHP